MNELTFSHISQIEADCLYANVFNRYCDDTLVAALKKSGNIEEFRTSADELAIADMRFLTMPILHVGGDTNLPQAVIVSTGSYSPIHAGHIAIMEKARSYVSSLGYQVIQGVLSASHDSYVSIKNGGIAKLHISKRSQKIYETIKDSDWLSFDRFEGEGVSCALNFSTVIERVRRMVLAHNKRARSDLKVFYVFGSDNVGFAEAFVGNEHYHGICVDRGGYGVDEEKKRLSDCPSVHFIEANDDTSWISSTKVRESVVIDDHFASEDDVYLIRSDCVSSEFVDELTDIIRESVIPGMKIKSFSSEDLVMSDVGTISLDKFVPGEYSLEVSRVFEVSSGQLSANSMTSLVRDIHEQISEIPAGSYVLVDDDSVSGYTMRTITEILSASGIEVNSTQTLIGQIIETSQNLYDVIDARDFLIGSTKCGLVVDLFGKCVRVPYAFPFVNLVSRARVLPERYLECSKKIWLMNKIYAGSRLISSLEESQRNLYEYLGFTGKVEDVCDYYINLIENSLGGQK